MFGWGWGPEGLLQGHSRGGPEHPPAARGDAHTPLGAPGGAGEVPALALSRKQLRKRFSFLSSHQVAAWRPWATPAGPVSPAPDSPRHS